MKTVAKALRTPGEPVKQLVSLLLPLSFGNSFWLCGEKRLITHHEQEGAWLSVALHNLALHVVCVCYHSATLFTHPQFFFNSVIFCTNTENARMKRQICSQGAYSSGAKGQVTSKQASSSDAVRKAQKLWGPARVMVPAEGRQDNLPRSTSAHPSAPRPRTVSEGGRADIVPRRRHS